MGFYILGFFCGWSERIRPPNGGQTIWYLHPGLWGRGEGGEEEIVQFAPLLPLGFRPLMSALYCGLSMGNMGIKDLQGIAKG